MQHKQRCNLLQIRRHQMNILTAKRFTTLIALSCALSMTACGGMSTRDKSTAIGAGIGAVGGAVLTGGSALGTVGGAAVGAVIGNQVGK
jgi:osmotically inducible lipoprotein OsmB